MASQVCMLKVSYDEDLILICLLFIASIFEALSYLHCREFYLESICYYGEQTYDVLK